jgi:hypothetical protein
MKAFPFIIESEKVAEPGMDLRDYFAAQALQGLLNEAHSDFNDIAIAELSYSLANAMMKARKL